MVWRSILLSMAQKQLLVGCREQLGIKDTEFESKVLHSFKTANWNQKDFGCFKAQKKCFFLRKLTKMSNLILCFSEISKFFICVRVWQGSFLSEDWKCYPFEAVFSLQFFALEKRGRKAYRKQTCLSFSKRCPL